MDSRIGSGGGGEKQERQNAQDDQKTRLAGDRVAHTRVKTIPLRRHGFNRGLHLASWRTGNELRYRVATGRRFCRDSFRLRFRTRTSVICVRHLSSRTILRPGIPSTQSEGAQMVNIPLVGVASVLVVSAIIARVFTGGEQKADKPQKAEIMKQLLALSDRENRVAGRARSGRPRAALWDQGRRADNSARKAAPKSSQPVPSNSPSPKSLIGS